MAHTGNTSQRKLSQHTRGSLYPPFLVAKANLYSTANLPSRHPHKPRILLNKGLPLILISPHIRRPSLPTCKSHLPSLRIPKLPRSNPHLDLPVRPHTQSLRLKRSRRRGGVPAVRVRFHLVQLCREHFHRLGSAVFPSLDDVGGSGG